MARERFTNKMAEVKKECNNAIVAFRVGDFYEFFAEDAVETSKILGLTLTSRYKASENPLPMTGFPYHQLENYLRRLLSAGRRVAICEEVPA